MKKTLLAIFLAALSIEAVAANKSGFALGMGATFFTQDLGNALDLVDEKVTYHFQGDYTFENGLFIGGSITPMHGLYAGSKIGNHSIYGGYQFDNGLRLKIGSSSVKIKDVIIYETPSYVETADSKQGGLLLGAGWVGKSPALPKGVKVFVDGSYSFLGSSSLNGRDYHGSSFSLKSDTGMARFTFGFKF